MNLLTRSSGTRQLMGIRLSRGLAALIVLLCLMSTPVFATTCSDEDNGSQVRFPQAGQSFDSSSVALNFVAGWNLVGNGSSTALSVACVFGDGSKVPTIWKWIASTAKCAFYAPTLAGQALTDYATSKGHDVLTTVAGGEGFWVNANQLFTLPSGASIDAISLLELAGPARYPRIVKKVV